eukprot:6208990-Pleurochrysis_carterae.AAC.4
MPADALASLARTVESRQVAERAEARSLHCAPSQFRQPIRYPAFRSLLLEPQCFFSVSVGKNALPTQSPLLSNAPVCGSNMCAHGCQYQQLYCGLTCWRSPLLR